MAATETGTPPAELFRQRQQRVLDAVALRVPDQVPLLASFGFFAARYTGITAREAMYDYPRLESAVKKTVQDFALDGFLTPHPLVGLGPLLDILQWRQLKWPGHGVPENSTYQFVEGEYMLAEEYEDFLADPTGYLLSTYLPRTYGALEGLQRLPSLPTVYYTRFLTGVRAFGLPEVSAALASLMAAGVEAQKLAARAASFRQEMEAAGFPPQFGGTAYAPFDYIGDLFRGTVGIMTDLYRRPEKLLALLEKITPFIIEGAVGSAEASGVPVVFMPLHKGLDGFMSLDHFLTFYWPSLQAVVLALIDRGIVPCVFWEGRCDSRLEHIRIPKGKAVYWFESTDMFRAKEVLGDTVCLRGNVPASLLCTGSPGEVRDYCRKLIEVVGKGGGFIMDGAIGLPEEARPENVGAMADATREFGRYA